MYTIYERDQPVLNHVYTTLVNDACWHVLCTLQVNTAGSFKCVVEADECQATSTKNGDCSASATCSDKVCLVVWRACSSGQSAVCVCGACACPLPPVYTQSGMLGCASQLRARENEAGLLSCLKKAIVLAKFQTERDSPREKP